MTTTQFTSELTTLISQVDELQLSISEKTALIGNVLIEWGGRAQRTFNYTKPLGSTASGCAPTFARTLEHRDWIDGESVVQAEETSLEEGFNLRFHAIEDDLDTLGADVAQAFVCVAELRSSIAGLLQEIRSELNRINRDVHECCNRDKGPGPSVGGGLNVGQFAGVTKLFEKDVMIWQIGQGYTVLPMVHLPSENVAEFGGYKRSMEAGAHVLEHRETYERVFEANTRPTVSTILETVGDDRLASGMTVREALRSLPGDLRVNSPDALVAALVDREASSMRASGEAEVVNGLIAGIGSSTTAAGDVTMERFTVVPDSSRTALEAIGIASVRELSARDPAEIGRALTDAGIKTDAATAASWVTAAALTTRLGR